MADDQFELLLKAWGISYGEVGLSAHHARKLSRMTYHPIAEGMQFAPGKKVSRATRALVGRDGRSRRRLMNKAAGVPGANPLAFVDPVRGKQSNSGQYGVSVRPVAPELQRVEKAAQALQEMHMLRGLCLRANYCVKGDHQEKADWVTEKFRQVSHDAEPVKLKRFRDELQFARVWIQGYLSWNAAA